MQWTIVLPILAVIAVFLWMKRSTQVPERDAIELLKRGALLIDVRTHSEFASGHLPRAINMPHNEIESLLPNRVHEKRTPLLLHCHSGMRSNLAQKKLQKLGYTQVFNLGSYQRATELVKASLG
jgi:phage shock protein E